MAIRGSHLGALRNVVVPALIVCGENDEPFVEPSRRMHDAISGSELVMIDGAGHSPQIETPARFNEILLGFFARVKESAEAG